MTGGVNKAHQGAQHHASYAAIVHVLTCVLCVPCRVGTDHQKIAKLDRDNEVAPPPKISPTVGKVCLLRHTPVPCAC